MSRLFTILVLVSVCHFAQAKHIVGGVLTYECLGTGQYRFTMRIYRDCSSDGAGFDFNAPFSIYKGKSQSPLATIRANPIMVHDIQPKADPCLQLPGNVCVQEGVYVFNYRFLDWPSNESYHISYQRCCRNESITNIPKPGEVGATFTVEITPASQASCNNSPVYNTFPPIVICANQPLRYDHSAVDKEGDQLVYELCAPLNGGGLAGLGSGNPRSCNGIAPDPACPPPYETITFLNPPYSMFNPLGGNPPVSIHPNTGQLMGFPSMLGQFTVGVCVSEYRNGKLLSSIRRDFQFNVADCEPLVDVRIQGDNISPKNNDFMVRTCNGLTIPFSNQSRDRRNITDYRWEFYINDSMHVYKTWDANVTFPKTGEYSGALYLNPGTVCGDSAKIFVEILPELVSKFEYDFDTCIAGPVSFFDKSHILGKGQISRWTWDFGDGRIDSTQKNPIHVYKNAGIIPVTLEVRDTNNCTDKNTINVYYRPLPALVVVKPNDTVSCPPAKVKFNNLSAPIDKSYKILWDFGDGKTSNEISPEHTYYDTGFFDVKLQITTPLGCYTEKFFDDLIEILPPPVVGFDFNPKNPDNFNPVVFFADSSKHAAQWEWFVNDRLVANVPDFSYKFPDTGFHEVTLIITHKEKCQDTLTQIIDVTPKVTFHMPTAFSPNGDSVNDLFKGAGVLLGVTNYRFEIWNRWGQLIFETDDPEAGWDGRVNNSLEFASSGIYVCKVKFDKPRGVPFEYKGFVSVIR